MQKFSIGAALLAGFFAAGFCVAANAQAAKDAGKTLSAPSVTENAKDETTGTIFGTVMDFYGNEVPDAVVMLDTIGKSQSRKVIADENGSFLINGLDPESSYRVRIHAQGYVDWSSDEIHVAPGQSIVLAKTGMKLAGDAVSVTVQGDSEQIATEQVELEVHQRVLGFIPNFYVVYDAEHAVPMTTKLKYKLALKVATDPVTAAGVGLLASVDQASNTPDYVQGMHGYGQRLGAVAADGFSDIMIGGAILPSLLHQDPRYFYQGTGTNSSRFRHAIFAPFVCRGDNGKREINFSSMGGDLLSSSLSNAYYPQSNRGYGLVFGNFAIGTAERLVSTLAQEFVLSRFTSKPSE